MEIAEDFLGKFSKVLLSFEASRLYGCASFMYDNSPIYMEYCFCYLYDNRSNILYQFTLKESTAKIINAELIFIYYINLIGTF